MSPSLHLFISLTRPSLLVADLQPAGPSPMTAGRDLATARLDPVTTGLDLATVGSLELDAAA
jgi:hypothetical protein